MAGRPGQAINERSFYFAEIVEPCAPLDETFSRVGGLDAAANAALSRVYP
jgi:hypothetical protein